MVRQRHQAGDAVTAGDGAEAIGTFMRIISCFRGHYQRQRCAPRLTWTNSITVSKTPMKIALSFVIRGTSTAAKLEQELGLSGVPFPTNCKVRQTSSAFPLVRTKSSCQAVSGNCHQCLRFRDAGVSNFSLLCQIFVKKNFIFARGRMTRCL